MLVRLRHFWRRLCTGKYRHFFLIVVFLEFFPEVGQQTLTLPRALAARRTQPVQEHPVARRTYNIKRWKRTNQNEIREGQQEAYTALLEIRRGSY